MNEAMVKEQARERLLSAELAEVLEVDLTAIDEGVASPPAPRRWLAAALLLLGVAVAGGVAWLRAHDVHEVQQREFDPMDPWWERVLYDVVLQDSLNSVAAVAALPPTRSSFSVDSRSGGEVIDAVLDRARVETLAWRADGAAFDQDRWRRMLAHEELNALCLGGPPACLAAPQLRELRQLPDLQTLVLIGNACTLDADAASALVELPKLRELLFVGNAVLPEGLVKLDGLPHLDALLISDTTRGPDVAALLPAVSRIRSLRALALEGRQGELDVEAVRSLRALRHLIALDLSHAGVTDEHLAALPDSLHALTLGKFGDGVTPAGIERIGRMSGLRSLGFHGSVLPRFSAALRQLIEQRSFECFELWVEVPDQQLWESLQALPRLRRLRIHDQSRGDEMPAARRAALEQARRCEHLEVFLFKVRELPTPEELSVLRDHPTLRRVCLERLERFAPGAPTAADVAALRAAVDFEVTVR